MNKKYLIPMLSIFALAIVTAGLGLYISNQVQVDVTVNHPILQEISEDGSNWEEGNEISSSLYGGESSEPFYIRDTNLASVSITGIPQNVVTNTEGVTCEDFISVIVTTETKIDGISQSISGPHDLILYNSVAPIGRFCEVVDSNTIVFNYGPDPLTYEIDQEDTSTIVVAFKSNAEGIYTFTSNILPA